MALRGLGMLASTGARRIVAVALVLFSAAAMAGPLLLVTSTAPSPFTATCAEAR